MTSPSPLITTPSHVFKNSPVQKVIGLLENQTQLKVKCLKDVQASAGLTFRCNQINQLITFDEVLHDKLNLAYIEALKSSEFLRPMDAAYHARNISDGDTCTWELSLIQSGTQVVVDALTPSHPYLVPCLHPMHGHMYFIGKLQQGNFKMMSKHEPFEMEYTPLAPVWAFITEFHPDKITYLSLDQLNAITLAWPSDGEGIEELETWYNLAASELLRNPLNFNIQEWEVIHAQYLDPKNIFLPSERFSDASPLSLQTQVYTFVTNAVIEDWNEVYQIYVSNRAIKISDATLASFKTALYNLDSTSKFGFVIDGPIHMSFYKSNPLDMLAYKIKPVGPRRTTYSLPSQFRTTWQALVSQLNWDDLRSTEIDGWIMDDVLGAIIHQLPWKQVMVLTPDTRFPWMG